MKIKTTSFITLVMLFFYSTVLSQEVMVSTIQLDANLSLDGLLMTPDGTLYGTEGFDGNRVFKINLDGSTEVIAAGLNGPIDMDYDTSGLIYVSTFNNAGLFKIDPFQTIPDVDYVATVTTGPSGVVVNRETGDVYVSHYGSGFPGNGNSIYKVTPNGTASIFAQGNGLNVPVSLAIDEEGNLYAPNIANARLYKITPDGTVSLLVQLPTANLHPFNIGHIAYANGYLYVTGNSSQPLVFKVSLEGEYEVIAGNGTIGGQDGLGSEAQFNGPNGIAASVTGDTLFISELGNPGVLRLIILPSTTTASKEVEPEVSFKIEQNSPNPFQQQTTIKYELKRAALVKISVYNMNGQLLDTLVREHKAAGHYQTEWKPEGLSSGTYFYQMDVEGMVLEKKAVLLRKERD